MEVVLVLDVGSTNFKAAAVASNGEIVWTWRQRQSPRPGPPYLHLDTSNVYRWIADSLAEAAVQFRIAAIIPCTHGSSAALVKADAVPEDDPDRDGLALPVMGYEAAVPDDVARDYDRVAPPFTEVYAPTNPAGLTLARQLYWQETRFADAFATVGTIMPYPQYWAWRLTGVKASDISSLGAQTHLWNPVERRFSALAVQHGWDRLIAPIRPAWDVVGMLSEPIARRAGLTEPVPVLCGIHDSSANCLRYLALPSRDWTLLSTGTWLITFNPGQPLDRLDPMRDTVSNTDVDGNPLACSRFMIGREFETLAGPDGVGLEGEGEKDSIDWLAALKSLIDRPVLALPSFTNTGGPMPGTGDCGRITIAGTEAAENDLGPVDRRALAGLYCALMTRESLEAVGAGTSLIVDGPFATDPLYPRLLASLMPGAQVRISEARDGTVLGSALLWDRQRGRAPQPPSLGRVTPVALPGLEAYARTWREAAGAG